MRRRDVVWAAIAAAVMLASTGWLLRGVERGAKAGEEPRAPGREVTNRSPGRVFRLDGFDPAPHQAAHPVEKRAPLRFAEAVQVDITPDSHGVWETAGGVANWTLRVEAPGALNLNFGFV
ncbi:MAG: hypothetical protein GWO24_05755, partial [Akkermansiaceae bacterium]|nr:hypothetical protein [Akkermansiaceae bacterium]